MNSPVRRVGIRGSDRRADRTDGAGRAILLVVYSLGLGVPFLLFGLAFTPLGVVRALRRHWRLVSATSGTAMVTFGVLIATGEFVQLTSRLSRFTGLSI